MTRRRVITVTQTELLLRLRAVRGRRLLVSAKPGSGNRYVLVEDVPSESSMKGDESGEHRGTDSEAGTGLEHLAHGHE